MRSGTAQLGDHRRSPHHGGHVLGISGRTGQDHGLAGIGTIFCLGIAADHQTGANPRARWLAAGKHSGGCPGRGFDVRLKGAFQLVGTDARHCFLRRNETLALEGYR